MYIHRSVVYRDLARANVPRPVVYCDLAHALIALVPRPVVYRDLELSYSSQCRVLSYTLPSLALSLILNLPKFMEAKLSFKVKIQYYQINTCVLYVHSMTYMMLGIYSDQSYLLQLSRQCYQVLRLHIYCVLLCGGNLILTPRAHNCIVFFAYRLCVVFVVCPTHRY